MHETHRIAERLDTRGNFPCALVTLVAVSGSSYRRPGARLLIESDGSRVGSISGGCLEADVIARAARVRATGAAEVVVYDTTSENDLVWGVGLGCHGVVHLLVERIDVAPDWAATLRRNAAQNRATPLRTVWTSPGPLPLGTSLAKAPLEGAGEIRVFEERVPPPTPLVVFGAGDDVQPLVRFARELGWHITVADPRPDFVTPGRFPAADRLVTSPAADLVAAVDPPANAVAVVMTHHYVHDLPMLGALFERDLAYLGLLGPKKRAARIVGDLQRSGTTVTDSQVRRLHAPVGLDLGADGPAEVALSIVAEIQAALAGRNAQSLRHRDTPIHEPSSLSLPA